MKLIKRLISLLAIGIMYCGLPFIMGGFWLEEWSQGEPEKQCYDCGEIYPISQLLATSLWYQGEEHPVYYCYKCGKLP